jgi:polyisoprenoid-binding protein YceI
MRACAAFWPPVAAFLMMAAPARPEALHEIDPHYGSIGFSVSHLGLFTSHGWFDRFDARLVIDQDHPEHTRVVVEVDAGSVGMGWPDAASMLRSADFFDVARYPKISFRSTHVAVEGPDRYLVRGMLELRGVARPLLLRARLLARQAEQGTADFAVEGVLDRSAFGMTADHVLIADEVRLAIRARIRLLAPPTAG